MDEIDELERLRDAISDLVAPQYVTHIELVRTIERLERRVSALEAYLERTADDHR